jgi:quinol monooxygenase YgiN
VFDIALAELLRFAEFPESLTYHHAVRLQPCEPYPQGHIAYGQRKGAIKSPGHACESVANIRLPEPQQRFRRTAFLSAAEKLLASAAVFLYTEQVVKQLASAQGSLGYSVLARPLSKRFWTLSAWNDEAALSAFVQYAPHVHLMAALAPHMDKTKFVQWTVKGSQLPLRWDDALRRFSSSST